MMRRLGILIVLCAVLGCFGAVVTVKMAPNDAGGQLDLDETDARTILGYVERCVDNPIERLLIQKFRLVQMKQNGVAIREIPSEEPAVYMEMPEMQSPPNSLFRSESLSPKQASFESRIQSYTVFSIPLSSFVVTGNARRFIECQRMM